MQTLFEIIHEDADLLVVNKPAGLVCHPTKGDVYSSLISRARLHLGAGATPGFPQLINRLDRETSGVLLIGKSPETSRELRRLWEDGKIEKLYLAIVRGAVRESEGMIDAPLGKDESSPIAIKDTIRPDGLAARTEFRRLGVFVVEGKDFSLLEIRPQTGRKHQIRIHLAHLGHPIVGDKIYGGDGQDYLDFVEGKLAEERWRELRLRNHALHACEVRFVLRSQETCFQADPEPDFVEFVVGACPALQADLRRANPRFPS